MQKSKDQPAEAKKTHPPEERMLASQLSTSGSNRLLPGYSLLISCNQANVSRIL